VPPALSASVVALDIGGVNLDSDRLVDELHGDDELVTTSGNADQASLGADMRRAEKLKFS
jgi:hypothetical protein